MEITNINIYPVFYGILDNSDFINYKQGIINYLYNRTKNSNGEVISNSGGWQQNKTDLIYDTNFRVYFNYFKAKLTTLIGSIYNISSFEITQAWGNINGKYHSNFSHAHPGSDIAACFYIKCNKNSGNIVLMNPIADFNRTINNKYKSDYNKKSYLSIEAKEGRLIIFPASIIHYVEQNLSDDYRISIAFNINIYKEN